MSKMTLSTSRTISLPSSSNTASVDNIPLASHCAVDSGVFNVVLDEIISSTHASQSACGIHQ